MEKENKFIKWLKQKAQLLFGGKKDAPMDINDGLEGFPNIQQLRAKFRHMVLWNELTGIGSTNYTNHLLRIAEKENLPIDTVFYQRMDGGEEPAHLTIGDIKNEKIIAWFNERLKSAK